MRNLWRCSLALGFAVGACTPPQHFDVIIENGTVIDGTGSIGVEADIGIRGTHIAAIGYLASDDAIRRVDASGLVVSPGFIDVHNHGERGLDKEDLKTNEGFVTQGVTTCVHGNDGFLSPTAMVELLETFERQGVGTNYAFFVGHNGIRREVMANENREPSEDELERMKELVREGMEAGAFGLSTGLMYLPGRYATTEEVIELAKVAAEYGGAYDSHVRDPAKNLVESVQECLDIGEVSGARPHPAHHKAPGQPNWGKSAELAEIIQAAIDRGVDVTVDQYPYDGAATAKLVDVLVAPPELGVDSRVEMLEALSDPDKLERIREATEHGLPGVYSWVETVGYDSFRIVVSESSPEYIGKLVSEAADEAGVDPFSLVVSLVLEEGPTAKITLGACSEDDVRDILTRPWTMVASDGAVTGFEDQGGHPRSRGTFPRVLGRYVREWNVLTLEEAVEKMTSKPAAFLGLRDRGTLAEGNVADITVFDPATIIDNSTWKEPSLLSTGVVHVLVNGQFALEDGAMTGETHGVFVARP